MSNATVSQKEVDNKDEKIYIGATELERSW